MDNKWNHTRSFDFRCGESAIERLTARVAELEARVAALEADNPVHSAACRRQHATEPCSCGAYNKAIVSVRRALGLEVGE